MSCSRWVSGGAFCRFWPISCSAMARSLSLMSTPLTRATVGSFAEDAVGGVDSCFWDEASFEQPAAIGRANSANASMAKVVERGRHAPSFGSAADGFCGAVMMVLVRVRRPPAAEAAGELRNRLRLAMVEYGWILTKT